MENALAEKQLLFYGGGSVLRQKLGRPQARRLAATWQRRVVETGGPQKGRVSCNGRRRRKQGCDAGGGMAGRANGVRVISFFALG